MGVPTTHSAAEGQRSRFPRPPGTSGLCVAPDGSGAHDVQMSTEPDQDASEVGESVLAEIDGRLDDSEQWQRSTVTEERARRAAQDAAGRGE